MVLLPLLLAFAAVVVATLAGWWRVGWAAPAGMVLTLAAFCATLVLWLIGGGQMAVSWVPTWGLEWAFALDGLAALFVLLSTGIGGMVRFYSNWYMPLHVHREHEPARRQVLFYFLLTLFMASMVGLAMAQDLIAVFVFWDLTTITSYYLIGFDRQLPDARYSALMALLVTGIASLFLLVGAFLLALQYGTFSLPVLLRAGQDNTPTTVALGLIALAALAKSAQVPLHFWLPRAMAAPTPVSSYLHSAAMVSAGILLLGRIYPLLRISVLLRNALLTVGLLSMIIASVLALIQDRFKRILAYSTIAQYGYVVYVWPGRAGGGSRGRVLCGCARHTQKRPVHGGWRGDRGY